VSSSNASLKQPVKVLQLATQSATAFAFVLPLAKHLRSKGYDVSIGCSLEPQHDVPLYGDAIEQAGFKLLSIPIPRQVKPQADLKVTRELVGILKAEQFDVIHTYNSKAGLVGRVAARIAGTPYVIHTDLGLPFQKAGLFSWKQSSIFWLAEWITARFTHRILTISNYEFEKAQKFFIARPPRLVNVNLGVNTDFYAPEAVLEAEYSPQIRALREKLSGKLVVGSAARMVPEKGIACLLDAAAICIKSYPNLAVMLLGDGPERKALESQAAQLGIADQVHFLGFIQDVREIRQYYSLMDIFVLPTRWESFGLVFAEAMSMEIPVVGTMIEPITSVVKHEETGYLVPPDDAAGFAKAILDLANNPDDRLKKGKAGRQRSIDLWDQKKILEHIESIYVELMNGTKPL
jgi:glycosyltransferase involved in cell wall biosynthesis